MAANPEGYVTWQRFLPGAGTPRAARLDLPAAGRDIPAAAVSPVGALPGGRDLRLDLFRGIALWLIFLDHIPENIVNLFTLRNYGFSDATEIFIFISGYTAAFVYGRAMRERGFIVSSARILRRAWQIYVAHIFLFTIFMAEIAYVAATFSNPLYAEEMNILGFLKQPDVTIFQALLLKFKPVNMDVLPLYIVLLMLFPPVLRLLLWQPAYALIGAAAVYILALHFNINLPAYPNGVWVFNPFAWQLLFVFGAWCAVGGAQRLGGLLRSNVVFAMAIIYLLFAFFITLTWRFESL
ncbi:MAG: OpgC family protein, partial [Xanthobacteraceae bacterium]